MRFQLEFTTTRLDNEAIYRTLNHFSYYSSDVSLMEDDTTNGECLMIAFKL